MDRIDYLILNNDKNLTQNELSEAGLNFVELEGKKIIPIGKNYIQYITQTSVFQEANKLIIFCGSLEKIKKICDKKQIAYSEVPRETKRVWGIFNKKLPWQELVINNIKNKHLTIAFRQFDSEKDFENFQHQLLPNSTRNGVSAIQRVLFNDNWQVEDLETLHSLFDKHVVYANEFEVLVKLESGQEIKFVLSDYSHCIIYNRVASTSEFNDTMVSSKGFEILNTDN